MGSNGSEIKRLSDDSVRRIVAEHAVTDLSSIVKELVDNSLDAESTTIKVRLFGQGMDIVEVSDDGSGVPLESRPHLAERYATSKIASFEDIYSGTGLTMGFRGEALFSMACLSKNLIVATRTEDEEMAQKLEFGRDGKLNTSTVQDIHRKVGTTVAVVEPFAALPARRTDMMRRIRGERTKLFKLLEAYAIFNVGVQLNLIDISSTGKEDMALATSSSSSTIEETVSSVLGHNFLGSLAKLDFSLEDVLKRDDENIYNWGISGLITKDPRGKNPNRCVNYYSINGRVVDLPKVTSLLRRIWQGFGGAKKPTCILSLTLPNDSFDVNLSPDKQQVLLSQEDEICQAIEECVTTLWASHTQGVFEVQQLEVPDEDENEMDDDAERQMHKRRFAFVHDLAKAKLQHQSDDRQRYKEDEEKKQCEAEASHSADGDNNGDGVRQPKRARVSSEQENASLSAVNSQEISTQELSRSPVDKLSDLERRKWTAVRARFNARDYSRNDEALTTASSSMVPVAPDDPLPMEGHKTRTSGQLSAASIEVSSRALNVVKKRKQLSLQDFAFKPAEELISEEPTSVLKSHRASDDKAEEQTTLHIEVEEGSSMRTRRRVTEDARSSAATDVGEPSEASTTREPVPRHKKHRGQIEPLNEASDVDDAVSSSTSTPPSSPEKSVPDRASPESGQFSQDIDVQAENAASEASSPDRSVGVPAADRRQVTITETVDATPPEQAEAVIWNSFRSTEYVCWSARQERAEAKKRHFSLKDVAQLHPVHSSEQMTNDIAESVGVTETNGSARISLAKEQFRGEMEIIGQFNMGFMLAKCRKNHLWILDQHACDEKYNFENLCRDTAIHEQKLLKPMQLDLSPAEESCILDNMDIFEANGFRFQFDTSAPIRHRLSLTALPHSGARDGRRAVQFNKDDVSTLCSIIMDGVSYDAGDGGTGTDGKGKFGNNAVRRYASTASSQYDNADKIIARLPKAIAMFASRACRSSIMIGTALSQKEMEKIVRRLADVEHPWNCPHGRPTMRHVSEFLSFMKRDERQAAEYFVEPTVTITPMTQEGSVEKPQDA